jgi:hypothetical protein
MIKRIRNNGNTKMPFAQMSGIDNLNWSLLPTLRGYYRECLKMCLIGLIIVSCLGNGHKQKIFAFISVDDFL